MTSQSDATGAPDAAPLALTMALSSAQTATQEQTLLRALERAEAGQTLAKDPAEGEEHLLCWLGETPYLVRLADLREVLSSLPAHVALPFSPHWLWGVFPLRADLVALVDPSPTLLHGPEAARRMIHAANASPRKTQASAVGRPEMPRALVVGEGDHLLALVADRIGDIYPLRPEDAGDADDHARPATAAHTLPAYVGGAYRIAGLERLALALRIAQVCDDIFAALQERPAHE